MDKNDFRELYYEVQQAGGRTLLDDQALSADDCYFQLYVAVQDERLRQSQYDKMLADYQAGVARAKNGTVYRFNVGRNPGGTAGTLDIFPPGMMP